MRRRRPGPRSRGGIATLPLHAVRTAFQAGARRRAISATAPRPLAKDTRGLATDTLIERSSRLPGARAPGVCARTQLLSGTPRAGRSPEPLLTGLGERVASRGQRERSAGGRDAGGEDDAGLLVRLGQVRAAAVAAKSRLAASEALRAVSTLPRHGRGACRPRRLLRHAERVRRPRGFITIFISGPPAMAR